MALGLNETRVLFFFVNIILFIYFCLCWIFIAAEAFSVVMESGGCSLVVVLGLLLAVASLVGEHGL